MQQLEMEGDSEKDGGLVRRCWPVLRQHVTSLLQMRTVDIVLRENFVYDMQGIISFSSFDMDVQ